MHPAAAVAAGSVAAARVASAVASPSPRPTRTSSPARTAAAPSPRWWPGGTVISTEKDSNGSKISVQIPEE